MKLNELPPATQPLNKTLKSIGLTKDQIAKMLGTKVVQYQPPTRRWRKVDPKIATAIINDKTRATYRELAKRHNVSIYYVWSVKNKQRTQ